MKKETIRKKKQLKNELHKKTRLPKAEEQKIPDYLAEIKDKGNFSKKNKIIIFGIIIILSFILYGNTICFGRSRATILLYIFLPKRTFWQE